MDGRTKLCPLDSHFDFLFWHVCFKCNLLSFVWQDNGPGGATVAMSDDEVEASVPTPKQVPLVDLSSESEDSSLDDNVDEMAWVYAYDAETDTATRRFVTREGSGFQQRSFRNLLDSIPSFAIYI